MRVFISYRRDDSQAATQWIYRELKASLGPDQIFFDFDTIPFGVNFKTFLQESVSSCGIMLAVIGRGWVDARNAEGERRLEDPADLVRIEIESALAQNLRVVPVLIDGASMPKATDLPPEMQDLIFQNGLEIDFARDLDAHLQRLVQVVMSIRRGGPSGVTHPPNASPSAGPNSARPLAGSAPPRSSPVTHPASHPAAPPSGAYGAVGDSGIGSSTRSAPPTAADTTSGTELSPPESRRQTFWETGTIKLPNGGAYEGSSVDGRPHGRGTCELPDGTRYEGTFVHGDLDGHATKHYSNGDRYEGGFVAWKRHGRGTFFKVSGDRFEGWYQDDAEHGRGVYYFASGARYDGGFFQGKRHGQGVFYHLDRDPERVRYEYGRRVRG